MIYDLLEVFKKEYEQKGDKLILDNYELKEGLYIKVKQDGSFEPFVLKKKNKALIFSDIDGGLNHSAYEWFKERDYYSDFSSKTAKTFDPPKKSIHSINYLTIFMKNENFSKIDILYLREKIFLKTLSFKEYQKDKEEKYILEHYCNWIDSYTRKRDISYKYKIIKKLIETIKEVSKNYPPNIYIKIFFDDAVHKYKKESEIYIALKIFNKNTYNKQFKDEVYGLSDANMGLNAKKPFLEHKSRNLKTPFMVKKEDALLLKKFFDWLKFQEYQNKTPLADEMFINRDFKEKDLIVDFDYIPVKTKKLTKPIQIKNHLLLKKSTILIEDEEIEYLNILEDKVDEILYDRQLNNSQLKKLDNHFASLIYSTRDAMLNYFKKYDDRGFFVVIKKYASYLAIEHLKRSRFLQAGMSLNLKFSLLEYKGEEVMDIKKMQENMLDKLLDNEYNKLTSEEFFYLCGQVARYLIKQSEAREKKGDMLEAYLRANNAKKLKRVIEMEYFKYKHAISINFVKFNNALSLIMAYDGNEKLTLSENMDSFLVGALSDNLFYMKKEE